MCVLTAWVALTEPATYAFEMQPSRSMYAGAAAISSLIVETSPASQL
jgi:hypothetical protein